MADPLVLHIPHTGLELPASYLGDILVPADVLRLNVSNDADLYVDQLFEGGGVVSLTPRFSRYVCDVERFRDESKEKESRRGRGLFYTHFEDGRQFRKNNDQVRDRVLNELYDPHHARFTEEVKNKLQAYGTCWIIDCHSFTDKTGYPDFCLGTDTFHTPAALLTRLQSVIEQSGYKVQVDFPYNGSIVPMEYYQQDSRVQTIMIEVNKRLYLNEATFQKKSKFKEIRKMCQEIVALVAARDT